MQLGMIGLGRMGANMVRRLMKNGHQCVVYDVNPATADALGKEGATPGHTIDEFLVEAYQAARDLADGARRRGRQNIGKPGS